MQIKELFLELQSAAIQIRNGIDVNELYKISEKNQKLEIFLGHINMLILQASQERERRTRSIIHSSWSTVEKFGREFGLFEKYIGDAILRQRLVHFLNTTDLNDGEDSC